VQANANLAGGGTFGFRYINELESIESTGCANLYSLHSGFLYLAVNISTIASGGAFSTLTDEISEAEEQF